MAEVKNESVDSKAELKEMFEELAGALLESFNIYEKMVVETDLNQKKEYQFDCYAIILNVQEELKDFLKSYRRHYGVKEAEVKKRMAEEEKKAEAQ